MNAKRIVAINIIILLLLAAGGAAAYYFIYNSTNYIKTDNARIDGQAVSVVSPVAGQLVNWNGELGRNFKSGDKIGEVSDGQQTFPVTVPVNSTIVQQSAVEKSLVTPGVPLARAYNLDDLWITANIEETDVNDVKVGQDVDVYVDAFPDTTFSGKVEKLGFATANTFSLLPSSNASGNYTKVTQVVPVTISLDGYKGAQFVPGMNVTVRIHK